MSSVRDIRRAAHPGLARGALLLFLLAGCKKTVEVEAHAREAAPVGVTSAANITASASTTSVMPRTTAASVASAPAPPPEMTPELETRVAKWKTRLIERARDPRVPYPWTLESITTEHERHGAFDVVTASIPTPVMAGGAEDTHARLVVTASGEVAYPDAAIVVGRADVDGDGREDLVFKDVRVVADRPGGPRSLKVGDKGGAQGWRETAIGAKDGKPVLLATTETNGKAEIDPRGFWYGQTTKGIREEVVLAWEGKQLAVASRRPLETKADAERRARNFAEEARLIRERSAGKLGACPSSCFDTCTTGDETGAACLATCSAGCGP